jgi:hypothetical protein
MARSFKSGSALVFALAAVGCGSEDASTPSPFSDELDLRQPIPTADSAFIDFVGGEFVIQPGEEMMGCTHLFYDGPDLAFSQLQTLQSDYGHHAVLLAAKDPLPPGTTEDCTDRASMSKYDAYTIGDQDLPADHGIFLPGGKAMVLQSHYVNANAKPIRVRDIVRMHKMEIAAVKTWASIHITNTLEFAIPSYDKKKLTFDCTVKNDVDLLLVGGHMHEWGSRFEFFYGPNEQELKSLYLADPWKQEYRDSPPMTLFFGKPMPLKAGSILRTVCEWNNDTSEELAFPKEMCTSFGYVAGSKEPVVCSIGQ